MNLHVVILAAGQGTRMRSKLPKVLHPVAGKPMLGHVIDCARSLSPTRIHVVIGHGAELVREQLAAEDIHWVLQTEQLGTGHAVAQALPGTQGADQVLVLYGDVPLLRVETLAQLSSQAGAQALGMLTRNHFAARGDAAVVQQGGRTALGGGIQSKQCGHGRILNSGGGHCTKMQRPVRPKSARVCWSSETDSVQRADNLGSDLLYAADTFNLGALGRALGCRQALVKLDQRLGLGVVDLQALAYGLFLVVITLDQVFTGNVVLASHLRRVVINVVNAAGTRVHAATGQAGDDFFVGNGDFQHAVDVDAGFNQRFSLRDGARETVEQETLGAIVLGDALFDQTDDQIVGDQAASIHDFLDLLAKLGAGLDRCAQHVAGGDLRNAEALADELGLCTLACPWGAQQDNSHDVLLV